MMARIQFQYDDRELRANLGSLDVRVNRAVKAVVGYTAVEGVRYMKDHAPWTDRTTNARNGLHTIPKSEGGRHEITFSHTVPYGIWLEIANSGRYAIIMPSVHHEGDLLMHRLTGLFGRLGHR